jgi:hypothetical protein
MRLYLYNLIISMTGWVQSCQNVIFIFVSIPTSYINSIMRKIRNSSVGWIKIWIICRLNLLSISFWFLSDILGHHLQTRLKNIFRFSHKGYMTYIDRILLKSCLLNKRWLLHWINCIHIKFKSMSKIRSLTQIQSSPKIQSPSKVNWLRSGINILIRFFGTKFHIINNLFRRRIHKRSKLLTASLWGKIFLLLDTLDTQNIKSLGSPNLETISSTLLNILCEHVFIFFLNYW